MNRTPIQTACVHVTGPDVQMDLVGDSYYKPANPLPIKCSHCTFPDLDYVARPYLLTKGVSSPTETSPAWLGNFLVRERVKRILELAVPGACKFFPTAESKGKKPAPWWLAVPQAKLAIPMPKAEPPFCSKCNEPKTWSCAMRSVWDVMGQFDTGGVDVFKSASWYCPRVVEDDFEEVNTHRKASKLEPLPWSKWGVEAPAHPQRWTRHMLSRELFFSVRLEQLFKHAKVKGQLHFVSFKPLEMTATDEIWIAEKLGILSENGLADAPKAVAAKSTKNSNKWFKDFLKRQGKKGLKKFDFTAVETRRKLVLPQDYKDFVMAIGTMSFEDVMETEGFTATIMLPAKLDFKDYRRGCIPDLEEEQSKIDGVMFATTDHGDAFVFDVSAGGGDYPVFWYDHEQNTLEPFAPSFAECIKRFACKN